MLSISGPQNEEENQPHIRILLDHPKRNFGMLAVMTSFIVSSMIFQNSIFNSLHIDHVVEPISLVNVLCIFSTGISGATTTSFCMFLAKSVFPLENYDSLGWILLVPCMILLPLHCWNIYCMARYGDALSAFPVSICVHILIQQFVQWVIYDPIYNMPWIFYGSCFGIAICGTCFIGAFQYDFDTRQKD